MLKKILLILMSVLLFSCGSNKGKDGEKIAVGKNIKIVNIIPEDIIKLNVSSGTVEPLNEVVEITKTGGTVSKVKFKNGDRVKKGDIIVALTDQDVHSAYLKTEATYNSNKSDYSIRKNNYNKFKQLYDKQLISENEYLVKKIDFVQGESNLKNSQAAYLSAKKDYEDLIIKSKIDGVITDLDIKIYEKITPNTEIVTVVNDSKMLVKTGVSVHEIENLSVGNRAEVVIEGLKDNYFGRVHEINPVANKESKKYQIKVEVENMDGKIKKGMYSKVLVETGVKNGYLVPKNAIVIKELYSYIFVVENGEAKRIKVERGYSNNEKQEVISEELYSSMKLIVDGQFMLEDRDQVNILN
ncbi:efflux RND transporter periplasmic adaptor subunit [uncultured Cetobacterium sp.]|uniref:efflux RND transporter periplasmic adaptor subunit n=1 Tax=uncultured Cetobacterium sp. TaxID=527638 RepID=UPI00262DDF01|nr:efflux RND transporter periplasmic adaptor subunit [uncultured Cetobacterium sp.]